MATVTREQATNYYLQLTMLRRKAGLNVAPVPKARGVSMPPEDAPPYQGELCPKTGLPFKQFGPSAPPKYIQTRQLEAEEANRKFFYYQD
jgi:hypothetical protein